MEAARECGVTVINACRYRFGHNSPDGCTVFLMLDESHISVHSYAEQGAMAVDVFVCGRDAQSKAEHIAAMARKSFVHSEARETQVRRFCLPDSPARCGSER